MDSIFEVFAIWPPAWIALFAIVCSVSYFLSRPRLRLKMLLGGVVVAIICAVDTPRGGTLLQIILMSVICAGGVGLIPLYGVAWLFGSFILQLIEKISGKMLVPESTKSASPTGDPVSSQAMAIRIYINECRALKIADTEIKQRLMEQQWTKADIEAALELSPLLF